MGFTANKSTSTQHPYFKDMGRGGSQPSRVEALRHSYFMVRWVGTLERELGKGVEGRFTTHASQPSKHSSGMYPHFKVG